MFTMRNNDFPIMQTPKTEAKSMADNLFDSANIVALIENHS